MIKFVKKQINNIKEYRRLRKLGIIKSVFDVKSKFLQMKNKVMMTKKEKYYATKPCSLFGCYDSKTLGCIDCERMNPELFEECLEESNDILVKKIHSLRDKKNKIFR